jgi:hypothetical protein
MEVNLMFVVAIHPSLNESPFNLLVVSMSKTYRQRTIVHYIFILRRVVMRCHKPTILEGLTVGKAKEQRSMRLNYLRIKENDLLGGV